MGYGDDVDSRRRSYFLTESLRHYASSGSEEKVVKNEPPDDGPRKREEYHPKVLAPIAPFNAATTLRANLKPYLKERLTSERGQAVIAQINDYLSAKNQPYSLQYSGDEVCLMRSKEPVVVGRIPVDQCAFSSFSYRGDGDPDENLERINSRFDFMRKSNYRIITGPEEELLLTNSWDNQSVKIGSRSEHKKGAFSLSLRKGGNLEILLVKLDPSREKILGVSTGTGEAQECTSTVGVPNHGRVSLELDNREVLGYDKGTPGKPRHIKISDLVAQIGRYVRLD